MNLLIAWTVVGWILLMVNALGYNPMPWVVFKVLAGRRSGADECTASSGSSLFARPDLWPMWRQWICAVFPLPGPRQLVHAAHHCPGDRATPKLLLLHEQRSHPLPIL